MSTERVGAVIKDLVELHLKTWSTVFDLSKGYVRAVDGIVRQSGRAAEDAASSGGPGQRRAPLLIAGVAGEEPSAAFVINNPSANEVAFTFAVQVQPGAEDVQVVPPSLALKANEEAVVRIKAKVTTSLEENRDYPGLVHVPGLSSQVIDFIVRRLPGPIPAESGGSAERPPRNAGMN
ncbi:MAG: hypothetical protein QOF14_1862 [Hyphomicrobiales bacterium]|jgi:hypothetical protein|nr:hypothetical protein [Hyphomicrobiales bacterium]